MPVVEIQALEQRFDDQVVLGGINLNVEDGEILAIMGSSGGGKTTLLRCISGLLTPTSGSVHVDGIDVRKQPDAARKRMGMVFQSAALFDYMNVRENVVFGIARQLKLDSHERESTANEALARVGLHPSEAGKMPSELSGGMRKRVGIARALALSPKVMLYDEPTTGLDPVTTYHIDSLIAGLRKERGMTSLLVSHDVSSVFRVADNIAFLDEGQIVFHGARADFEASPHPAIRELIDKSRATAFDL